jgi:NADPH:quinone reductase-like Zn-dependent oxidoreductase
LKETAIMKAIQFRSYGGYEEHRVVDVAEPKPAEGEALVRMQTVGINPLDDTLRAGKIFFATPENLPRIGGQTGVGVVTESKVGGYKSGDRVFVTGRGFGLLVDGTWREFVAAPASGLSHVPSHINNDQAAAFLAGAGYITGYLSLTEFAGFKPGQTVLAPGIGGAVGMESVQIARKLGASLAISTATTTVKAERARSAGYEHIVDLSRESLRDGVMRLTGGKGVDVIIDGVGGGLTGQAFGCLANGGTYVVVGYAAGRDAAINLTDIIWKAAKVRGFTLRAFSAETLAVANTTLLGYLAEGAITPMADQVFPLGEAAAAVRHLMEGGPFGRVIMRVNG